MSEKEHLLTSKQMAQFVADGFLRFDDMVPDHLNQAAYAEMSEGKVPGIPAGAPLSQGWTDSALGEVFRLPQIQGKNLLTQTRHAAPFKD